MNTVVIVGLGVLALAAFNAIFGASGGYGINSPLDDVMFHLAYPLIGVGLVLIAIGIAIEVVA